MSTPIEINEEHLPVCSFCHLSAPDNDLDIIETPRYFTTEAYICHMCVSDCIRLLADENLRNTYHVRDANFKRNLFVFASALTSILERARRNNDYDR